MGQTQEKGSDMVQSSISLFDDGYNLLIMCGNVLVLIRLFYPNFMMMMHSYFLLIYARSELRVNR